MPKRLQRSRKKGWRKPLDAIYVGRPTKWGNPFYPGSGLSMGGVDDHGYLVFPKPTPAHCVAWFRLRLEDIRQVRPHEVEELLAPLRGKDLLCWCLLDQPCHADVWLELANRPAEERGAL